MEGLNYSIPRRLTLLRLLTTFALIISFALSFSLWNADHFFPATPLQGFENIPSVTQSLLALLSCILLFASLFLRLTRTLFFLTLLINIFLVLCDLNRLQPWFYCYNAILFILLFYDGRVDNNNKFTTVFILIQIVFASVYIINGFNQLMNPLFVSTDLYETLQPVQSLISVRQFNFLMACGKFIPVFIILTGLLLCLRPARYLGIAFAIILHVSLLFLLFPSAHNQNYALWFMNLVFVIGVLLLFSGDTRQKYFSAMVLFQKPVFYCIACCFLIVPVYGFFHPLPPTITFKFRCGENIYYSAISEEHYNHLPLYVKAFCIKKNDGIFLDVQKWCRHETGADLLMHGQYHNSDTKTFMVRSRIFQNKKTDLSMR